MSSDRFNFLEFEEQEPSEQTDFSEHALQPLQRAIAAERLSDGTALAEVRITDLRGYQTEEGDDDQAMTLSSRAALQPKPPPKLRVTEVFGERGAKAGQFYYPAGMAVDSAGVLFVADSYHHRLQRITPSGGVAVVGGRGGGRGQFQSPQGVATDEDDAFYVVEQGNHRVQKFTREGVLALVFGKQGRGEGELNGPTALAVAPGTGDIFVADTGNSRIQRFNYEGRFLNILGASGLYGPGLSSPQALAVTPGGSLYAADTFAQRLVRFDPMGRPDLEIGGAKPRSSRNGPLSLTRHPLSLHQPRALAFDRTGLLYIADGGEPDEITGETRGRLQCFCLSENRVLATLDKIGRSLGTLLRPGGLAVGPVAHFDAQGGQPRGDLYVADTMNHRILRFVWS
jgi:DNA-binding beta-propeller fold protein YncE